MDINRFLKHTHTNEPVHEIVCFSFCQRVLCSHTRGVNVDEDSDQYLYLQGKDPYVPTHSRLPASMRGSRKFCQRGSNFDNVFFY